MYICQAFRREIKDWKTPKAIKDVQVMEAKTLLINWRSQESLVLFLFFFSFDIHRHVNLGGLVVGTQFLELDFTFIPAINTVQLFSFCCNYTEEGHKEKLFL